MPTLTEIEPCDPPVLLRDRTTGPTIPLDHEILRVLRTWGPAELREIRDLVDDTTHHVHARVRMLADRGLVERRVLAGGPRRGPGASVYQLTERGREWPSPAQS